MYVSAWLLTIPWMDPQLLMNLLQNVSFNISIVSLVALVSHNHTLRCDVSTISYTVFMSGGCLGSFFQDEDPAAKS